MLETSRPLSPGWYATSIMAFKGSTGGTLMQVASPDEVVSHCPVVYAHSYLSTMRKQGHAMLVALAAIFAAQPLPITWEEEGCTNA